MYVINAKSDLTHRWYFVKSYQDFGNGNIVARGLKIDITEQFEAALEAIEQLRSAAASHSQAQEVVERDRALAANVQLAVKEIQSSIRYSPYDKNVQVAFVRLNEVAATLDSHPSESDSKKAGGA